MIVRPKTLIVIALGALSAGAIVGALYVVQKPLSSVSLKDEKKFSHDKNVSERESKGWFERMANGFETTSLYPATEREVILD